MISGPRPGPALSAGSILNRKTLLPRSTVDATPAFHLKSSLTPVDPYRKFRNTESPKPSVNEGDIVTCAPPAIPIKRKPKIVIICFAFINLIFYVADEDPLL